MPAKITCTRCGVHLSHDDVPTHAAACRPRFWYWYPREESRSFGFVMFAFGFTVAMFLAELAY
jgi:hypothetical protein